MKESSEKQGPEKETFEEWTERVERDGEERQAKRDIEEARPGEGAPEVLARLKKENYTYLGREDDPGKLRIYQSYGSEKSGFRIVAINYGSKKTYLIFRHRENK